MSTSDIGRVLLRESAFLPWIHVGATGRDIARVTGGGEQILQDPGWLQVNAAPVGGSGTIDWTPEGSIWRGSGEPWEGRTVQLSAAVDDHRVLRMAGCRTEAMGQWALATPGWLYAAQVKVRAKTSPGTATYLILSFLDEKGVHIDMGRVDRLPPDAAVQEVELCVVARAPANAKYIGLAVCAYNQINDDFAEFSGPSLRQITD